MLFKLHCKTEIAGWQTDLKSKERQALPKGVELEVEISFNTQGLTLAKKASFQKPVWSSVVWGDSIHMSVG